MGDGLVDATTKVIWLQTSLLYCDIRIPADRPEFGDCASLTDLDDEALRWLAGQQGFAGHLESADDLCFWHRHIDLQPPSPMPDAGRMHATGDRTIESGLFQHYTEAWRLAEAGDSDVLAAKLLLQGGAGEAALSQGFLLAQGDSFMFALERRTPPEQRSALLRKAYHDFEREALLAALDFEISLGTRRNGRLPWEITLSTLPFLEGRSLMAAGGMTGCDRIDRGILRSRAHHWIEYERGAGFSWL